MFDRTWDLLHFPRRVEEVHLVILLSDFVRHAASPGLNFIELELLLVVSCLANVNFLIGRESSRATFVVSSKEHYKTTIDHFINMMISILASLNHFVLEKMFFVPVDCLLRSIVPACVDPLLPFGILPCSVNLGNNRLRKVVWILKMYPITFQLVSSE